MGCGRRAPKPELLRFGALEGVLVPDVEGRLPGRGAYLHRSQQCLERAVRRRGFNRALRRPVTIPESLDLELHGREAHS